MRNIRPKLLVITMMILPHLLISQSTRNQHIATIVYLDSVVVKATQSGFSVEDFIEMVQKDQSFYAGFRNLRTSSYIMETDMKFEGRKPRQNTYYQATHMQSYSFPCRELRLLKEDQGKRFRRNNGKNRYYTSELYERLFAREGVFCDSVTDERIAEGFTDERGHIGELKRLLFSPGESSNVPFIGKKTAIFSERMADYYDFEIRSEPWEDNREAFVFNVKVKPEYLDRKENHTVIKQLSTYFDRENWQVLCRKYRLQHKTALFHFDVLMEIRLEKEGHKYFPEKISYQGDWNIPTKRREIGSFSLDFSEFK